MSARFFSVGASSTFSCDPTDTNIFLPSGENCDIARTVMAAAGKIEQMLRRPGAGHIAVVIGKAHHRIHVGDVNPLRDRFPSG